MKIFLFKLIISGAVLHSQIASADSGPMDLHPIYDKIKVLNSYCEKTLKPSINDFLSKLDAVANADVSTKSVCNSAGNKAVDVFTKTCGDEVSSLNTKFSELQSAQATLLQLTTSLDAQQKISPNSAPKVFFEQTKSLYTQTRTQLILVKGISDQIANMAGTATSDTDGTGYIKDSSQLKNEFLQTVDQLSNNPVKSQAATKRSEAIIQSEKIGSQFHDYAADMMDIGYAAQNFSKVCQQKITECESNSAKLDESIKNLKIP